MNVILACDKNFGIGIDDKLPWKNKHDMKRFMNLTKNNIVVMGRKTFESLNCIPLKNRTNVIISPSYCDNKITIEDALIFDNPYDFIRYYYTIEDNRKEIWVIGGAKLYDFIFKHYEIKKIYLTKIDKVYDCNVFLTEKTIKYLNDVVWTKETEFTHNESDETVKYKFYDYINSNFNS